MGAIVDIIGLVNPGSLDNAWGAITLGMYFTSSYTGSVLAARYYKSAADIQTHTCSLWTAGGTLVARCSSSVSQSNSGWQTMSFSPPYYTISASTGYVISFHTKWGGSYQGGYFNSAVVPTSYPPFLPKYFLMPAGSGRYSYSATDTFPSTGGNEWYAVDATINYDWADTNLSASRYENSKRGAIGYIKGINLGGPSSYLGDTPFGRDLQVGVTQSMHEGSPASPSLKLEIPGFWRFRWAVQPGRRTISVNTKQSSSITLNTRPSIKVKAEPSLGIMTDVVASASISQNWVTMGPIAFTPTLGGSVWVELWNNDTYNFDDPAYFDHIVTT